MSSLDFELDSQMSHLESEWRQATQAGNDVRAELKALAASPTVKAIMIEQARERLEDGFLGRDS